MMYFTKMVLTPKQVADAGIVSARGLHEAIWAIMPEDRDAKRDWLARMARPGILHGGMILYLLSSRRPERPTWCSEMDTKPFDPTFTAGQKLFIDLYALPFMRHTLPREEGETKWRRGRVWYLRSYNERRDWLARKGEKCGFRLDPMTPLSIVRTQNGAQGEKVGGVADACVFRGAIEVTAPDIFLESVKTGIGKGKAFGLGLMLLRSAA